MLVTKRIYRKGDINLICVKIDTKREQIKKSILFDIAMLAYNNISIMNTSEVYFEFSGLREAQNINERYKSNTLLSQLEGYAKSHNLKFDIVTIIW